jgi:hypothetical protein
MYTKVINLLLLCSMLWHLALGCHVCVADCSRAQQEINKLTVNTLHDHRCCQHPGQPLPDSASESDTTDCPQQHQHDDNCCMMAGIVNSLNIADSLINVDHYQCLVTFDYKQNGSFCYPIQQLNPIVHSLNSVFHLPLRI